MTQEIQHFITFLHNVKNTSKNTEISYERDLRKMSQYFAEKGILKVTDVTSESLREYLSYLEKDGRKASTISRCIASMKAFFHYLQESGRILDNPAESLKSPKIEKKAPTFLSVGEKNLLLEQPSGDSPKALRDKAMLELLYATGIRISELISLKINDIDLQLEVLICSHENKEKVVPFGDEAKKAVEKYLESGRPELVGTDGCEWLFTNCSGQSMSRQGFWKLIKFYAKKAGIASEITPHSLGHSFEAHLVDKETDLSSMKQLSGQVVLTDKKKISNI